MTTKKDTFCIAPYKNVFLDAKGNIKSCCVSREKISYKFNEIKDWYHSKELRTLRQNHLAGIKDPRCFYCWMEEENGSWSQRQHNNKHIAGIDPKSFSEDYKNVQAQIENLEVKNINSFDLRLGNLCNLKCVMCDATQSSTLLAEAQMNPELKKFYGDEKAKDYDWAKSQDFVQWCDQWLPDVVNIKFTGGEPLINPYIVPTLSKIPNSQKAKATLHFTTNLTKMDNKLLELLGKFKSVEILISVEGVGQVLEYARYPHKWNNLDENIKLLMDKKLQNTKVCIQHVVQAITLFDTINLARYFDGLGLKIHPIYLSRPPHLSIDVLKEKSKVKFLEKLEDYNGFNIDFINSVKKFVLTKVNQKTDLVGTTLEHLNAIDQIRGNKFTDILPIDHLV